MQPMLLDLRIGWCLSLSHATVHKLDPFPGESLCRREREGPLRCLQKDPVFFSFIGFDYSFCGPSCWEGWRLPLHLPVRLENPDMAAWERGSVCITPSASNPLCWVTPEILLHPRLPESRGDPRNDLFDRVLRRRPGFATTICSTNNPGFYALAFALLTLRPPIF